MLFVDTTHTVKIGSDVNRIILDVLPGTPAGGLRPLSRHLPAVGIFAPAPGHRVLRAEQYLLQAFLAFNHQFEIVLPAHALHRRYPADFTRLVRSAPATTPPSSFWLRRTDSPRSKS